MTNGVLPGNSNILLEVREPFLDELIDVIETHGVAGAGEDGDHDKFLVAEGRLGVGITILKRITVHDFILHLCTIITIPCIDRRWNYELVDVHVKRWGKSRFQLLSQKIVQKVFFGTCTGFETLSICGRVGDGK